MAVEPLSVRLKTKASVPPAGRGGNAGLAARCQIGIAGGAGNINLVAGNSEAADVAAGLQRAQILGPERRRGDVAAGIFGHHGIAILHAGDIKAAITAGCGGADLIGAAGAELVFCQQVAIGIELGEIGIAAALRCLAGADHAAGNCAADIDVAAGVDADALAWLVARV